MDKIVETYNPYNQNVERKSSQLPWYINETFINSVEIRSPFIAGNKWYIGWTLQVWQEWIIIDGNTRTISSTNYIENTSWWIINWDGNAEFNNIIARWTFILSWWQTVEDAISNIDVSWDWLSNKPSVLSLAAISNPTPVWSWLFISNTHMWYYSSWQWKTFMQNNGNFWLAWSWTNSLSWDWTTLNITGNISASSISWWTINGTTITWWTIQTSNTWARIELDSTDDFRVYDSWWIVRLRISSDFNDVWYPAIWFFDTSNNNVWQITWWTSWWLLIKWSTSPMFNNTYNLWSSWLRWSWIWCNNIDASWNISAWNNIFANWNITSNTDIIAWDDLIVNNDIVWWWTLTVWHINASSDVIDIYWFKINRTNVFPWAPWWSPVWRMQFMTTDINWNNIIYVIPIYNP